MFASRRWCAAPTVRNRSRSRWGPVRASPGASGWVQSKAWPPAAPRGIAPRRSGGWRCRWRRRPADHPVAPAKVLETQRHTVCLVAVHHDRQALLRTAPMVFGERDAVERRENVDKMIRERNGRLAESHLRHVMIGPRDADMVGVDVKKRLSALDPGHDSVSRCGGARVYERSTAMGTVIGGRTAPLRATVTSPCHGSYCALVVRSNCLPSGRSSENSPSGSVCTAIS